MRNTERGRTTEGLQCEILSRYSGLRQSLFALCDPRGEEKGPLSFEQIVAILSVDKPARDAARSYLSRGSKGYERDSEGAVSQREKLAWEIVEHLTAN